MMRALGWLAAVALALVVLALPQRVDAAVHRFAVLVGNNEGARDEVELRYAERDVDKLAEVLRDLGDFRQQNMVVLKGEDASAVMAAIVDVNERIRRHIAAGDEVILFVYYSGHASSDALHLGGSELQVLVLQQLVRGSPATIRMLVVDACRSGAITRVKGGAVGPAFSIELDERLAGSGAILLTSSAAGEDAQESDEIQGSFFTHYLVSGLTGAADSNRDGAVAIEEAYRFAYDGTLRSSSRTLAGTQHPTFEYDLRGKGDVVLTRLASGRRRGRLVLPADRTWLVFKGDRDGAVVAEVNARDRIREVWLRGGRYFVIGRASDHLLEGSVALEPDRRLALDEDTLVRSEYARLVRKGSGGRSTSHGPQLGYRFHTPLWWRTSSLCHGVHVGYLVETRYLSIATRAGWCRAGFENEVLRATIDEIDGELRLSHVWDFRVVSIELGLVGGAGVLHQRFTGTEGIAPPRTIALGQVGAAFGLLWDLPRGFYVLTDLGLHTLFFRGRDGGDGIAAVFAVRPSAGIGKRF